jgi:hypothetical protein
MQNAINIDHANRVIWFPLELQALKGLTAKVRQGNAGGGIEPRRHGGHDEMAG